MKDTVNYLGVILDTDIRMTKHINYVIPKVEKKINYLLRLMPNIRGPGAGKRKLLNTVFESTLLYGAPVWKDAMRYNKYAKKLESLQRKLGIRSIMAYRTTSYMAVCIIARVIPITLLIEERTSIYKKEDRAECRNETLNKLQTLWENGDKAEWTRKLIKNTKSWYNRKHGEVDFYTTQFLTGHGNFNKYLCKYKKRDNGRCSYCNAEDDAKHTFFVCKKWEKERQRVEETTGINVLNEENIIEKMLENEDNWEAMTGFIKEVMEKKSDVLKIK